MRVTIQNLGIIQDATVDVKPLTVFVGPNNEGKTWVAYLIAAMFGSYGFTHCIETIEKHLDKFPPLNNAIHELLETGSAKLDYVQFAEDYLEVYFNHIAGQAPNWLRSYLNGRGVSLEKLSVQVAFAAQDRQWVRNFIRALPYNQEWPERRPVRADTQQASAIRTFKAAGERIIHFFAQGKALEELPLPLIRSNIATVVLRFLHRSVYVNTYVFPVERTTYMTVLPPEIYGADTVERPARSRKPIPDQVPLPIGPVVQFMGMVGTAMATNLEDRRDPAEAPEWAGIVTKYLDLATLLERDILGGTVDAPRTEDGAPREMRFHLSNGADLSLPLVSSMVKELSPLVLYVRYVALDGDLIVIDEPEMNLHPEAQARLMEFLAMLVNARIKVLITTHSSYMVDHLVNLMVAAEYPNPDTLAKEFFLQDKRAFIDKEKVSVYLFEKGTATDILEPDGMVNWRTFSRVSDRLADIYARLHQE